MPTYRNSTDHVKSYESGGKIYSFPPKRDVAIAECVPYQELGLELVNENYPPVPSKLVVSGRFKFNAGMERKFNIPHSENYGIKIQVKSGALKLYMGSSPVGVEISGAYETVNRWSYAPYVKMKGIEAGTEAKIQIELERM